MNRAYGSFIAYISFINEQVKTTAYDYSSAANKTDWKLCISGMQPLDTTKSSLNEKLSYFSSESLKEYLPIDDQFEQLLRLTMNDRRHIKYTGTVYRNDYDSENYNEDYRD